MTLNSLPCCLLLLVALFFPFSTGYVIKVTPYLTDVVEVNWPFICNLKRTDPNAPLVVDVLLVNLSINNSTVLSTNHDLSQETGRNFMVTTPFVPDIHRYIIRLVDSSDQRPLDDSDDFPIDAYDPPPTVAYPIMSQPSSSPTFRPNFQPPPPPPFPGHGMDRKVLAGIAGGSIAALFIVSIVGTVIFCRWKQRQARKRFHKRMFPNMRATAKAEPASLVDSLPSHNSPPSRTPSISRSSTSRASLQTYITSHTHNTLFPTSPPKAVHRLELDSATTRTVSVDLRRRSVAFGYQPHTLAGVLPSDISVDEQLMLLKEKIRLLETQQREQPARQNLSPRQRPHSIATDSESLPQYEHQLDNTTHSLLHTDKTECFCPSCV